MQILAKRAIKRVAGLMSSALAPTTPAPPPGTVCIFVYHRVWSGGVTDWRVDDWNISPSRLAQHIRSLAGRSEFLFARELPDRLSRRTSADAPTQVCLTFDDGYQNFHDEVLPTLVRYGVKATVFVVTGSIGSKAPMPFDRWGRRHAEAVPAAAWQPLDWPSIERCLASGLVEIGSHSHRHQNAAVSATVVEEPAQSRDILRRRLGANAAQSYAYPYGSTRLGQVTPAYVQAVRDAGYRVGLTTDLGLAMAAADRLRLPRVEASGLDTSTVIRAKARGSLLPYTCIQRLRRAER